MERFMERRAVSTVACAVFLLLILVVTGLGALFMHVILVLMVPTATLLATAYNYRKELLEGGLRRATGGLPVQCEIDGINFCSARLLKVRIGGDRPFIVSVHQCGIGFKWTRAGGSEDDGEEHDTGVDRTPTGSWWYPCGAELGVGAIDVEFCWSASTSGGADPQPRQNNADLLSARTAIQKVLVKVATFISLRVERFRFSVRRGAYTLLVTVPGGIRFGTGDKPNERDLQTAEFRSVIQAREGAVPLNRTTRGGASGSSPGSGSGPNQNASTNERRRGETDLEPGCRRRARPSHLPALLEIPAINVTLLRDHGGEPVRASTATTNQRFCGVTATVGLAVGLDDANTLAIDVFPVYVKVDLDEMNYIREFAQLWSHPRSVHAHVSAAAPEQVPSVPAPSPQRDVLSLLPTVTTLACEGSVVELMSNRGQRSLLVVAESMYVDLDCTASAQPLATTSAPTPTGGVEVKCRLRSVTVTCMHQSRPGQPVKALFVRSTVINTRLARSPVAVEGGGAWVPSALIVAVATVQADLDDTDHGLLGWAAALRELRPRARKCTDGTRLAHGTAARPLGCAAPGGRSVPSTGGGMFARLASSSGLVDIQLSDVCMTLRTRQLDGVSCVGNAPGASEGVQVAKPPDALCQTVTVVTVDTMAINSDKVSRTTHRVCTVEITDVDATLRDGVVDSAGEDDNNDDSMAIFAHRSPASTPPVADRGGVPGNGRRGGQPAPALAPRTLARASLTRATVDIKMSQQTQVSGRKKSPGQMRVRTKVVMVHPVCRAALECGAVVEHMQRRLRLFSVDSTSAGGPSAPPSTPWYTDMALELQAQVMDGSVGVCDVTASDLVHCTTNSIDVNVSEILLTKIDPGFGGSAAAGRPTVSLLPATAGSGKAPPGHAAEPLTASPRQHAFKVTCAVAQASVYVRSRDGDTAAAQTDPPGGPAVKISSLDVAMDRFVVCAGPLGTGQCFQDDVTLSVPQVESYFDIHRVVTLIEVATTAKALLPRAGTRPGRGHTAGTTHHEDGTYAAGEGGTNPTRRHVHCTLGVARCLFMAPPTTTHRPCAPACDPIETCGAVDYVLKISTMAVTVGGGVAEGLAFRVTCASVAGLADGVEAIVGRGVGVTLRHGQHPDLDELRGKCARHRDHAAAPERFHVTADEDDAHCERPDAPTAWWFDAVQSATTAVLTISIDRIRVLYPHGFNFGLHVEHVQNTFFGVRRRYRDASGYVPPVEKPMVLPNLRIRSKSFAFEIEDDPFEARLLLGYRLREEERDARAQRGMVLEQRLAKLQTDAMANGDALDPAWIARARESLERENARIYCTRYNTIRPKCTKSVLFAVTFADLEVALLNDKRLTSNAQVWQTMKAVDATATFPDPMPEPGFSIAWRMNLDVKALQVSVRRFPCNLVEGKQVSVAGILMLQGNVPTDAQFRTLRRTVDVGDGVVCVERDGMPMHVYHSLRVSADHLGYAWGACCDAAIQQSVLRLDLLMNRGVVTSPSMGVAMPWFDKLRQLRHGPIEIVSKRVTLTLMAETDPNINNNFIEFRLTNVVAAWHNSILELASGVDIVLFPKSRFYGCPLLSVTSLQCTVTLEWQPDGGERFRTQHYTSDLDKFKSSSVNILIAVQRPTTEGHCACVLYAGTMVWIGRVYNDLFSVGRPRIKRGPLWQTLRPPRINTLGQHIAVTQLCLNLRDTSLLYYNDFDRKYGVTVSAGDVLYVTTYNQEIVEKDTSVTDDGLRLQGTCREWQYAFEKLELSTVTAHCSNRGTPGGMSRQFRSGKGAESGDGARGKSDAQAAPDTDESDDDDDDDASGTDRGIDFENLVTEIEVLLAEEHAGLGADGTMGIEEVTALDDDGDVQVVRSHLFEATLIRYDRSSHGADPRLRRRSSAMSPRSPRVSTPLAPDPKGRSSQDEDEHCVHKVFLKDFNLIYTVFTADILWAVNEAYAEHNALAFELSADVIATPDTSEEGVSKLAGMRSNSTSGRRSHIGRDSDLLNMLVQDAESNLASTNSLPAESKSSHTADGAGLERLFHDAISMFMQIRFSRPQIFFRGPDKGAPFIQVSESVQLDLRHHKLVEITGRVNCKDSWTFNFANMQYFSAADVPQYRHVWVPYECVEFQSGGVREDMPKNFHCLAPASELVYISVFHYFDKTIAKAHDPLMLRRRKRNVDLEKVDKDLGQDFYVYETDCLNLTVTSKEWEGITDILTNVIFVGGDAAVEQQHEIEILKFKNTITDQEEQNKGAAEIEKTIKYISRLQHAVQDFQRAHNQLERLLVSMHREEMDDGASTVDAEARQLLRDHLHSDLVRTKRMFTRVRAHLRTRVLALNEYLLNPTMGQDNTRVWNARYEVKFDDLFLTFVTDAGQKICRTTVRQLEYAWNWHNTGFGEQLLECHDMVVADCWPSAVPDKHGTGAGGVSRASVSSEDAGGGSGAATPMMGDVQGNIVERFHGAATGAAQRGPDHTAVRVYVRDGKIVGGIPVTELLEVNLVPLNINIRQTVVDAIMEFLFPKDTPEGAENPAAGLGDDGADRTRRRSSRASLRPPSAVSSVSSVDEVPAVDVAGSRSRVGSAPPAPPTRRNRRHSLSSADDGKAIVAAARRHIASVGGSDGAGGGTGGRGSLPGTGMPPSRSASSVIDEDDALSLPVFPSSSCESMSASDVPMPPLRRHRGDAVTFVADADQLLGTSDTTATSRPPVAPARRRHMTAVPTSTATNAGAVPPDAARGKDLRRHVLHRRSASGNVDMQALTGGAMPGKGPNGALSGSMTSLHLLSLSPSEGTPGGDARQTSPPRRNTHRRAMSLHVPPTDGGPSSAASALISPQAPSSETSDGGDLENEILEIIGTAPAKPSPEIRRRNSIRKLMDRSKATSKHQHTQAAQVAAMKRRSARHRTYICLKVPSVTVCVTYRRKDGDKSSMIDLKDVVLTLPLLEYHNRTCTFETLLNYIKADCTSSVLHAVLKTKVLGISAVGKTAKRTQAMEALTADAARKETLLFGSDKKVAKLEKKHEKALKKLEKEEKKARKKTEKSVAKKT